ncbi:MAG: cyanophycinase [Myxococcota bacterium]|nr:cyanophycinase [Myxococcota bacterium]
MSPSRSSIDETRGWIVPVGGAEEKVGHPKILQRFVRISGEEDSRIAIVPTASSLDETGRNYEDIFRDLGAQSAISLPYRERVDTERGDWFETLENATGVFFTGGNQLRLSTTLGGTQVASLVRRLNAQGIPVGGTSAGAAILPEHMIAYGGIGGTPLAGMVSLAPGLGLTNRFLIDQHFRQRDRLGRLLSALSFNPFAVGLGLDEDTAAFISPDNLVRVVGSGAVTVVDVSELGHSSIADAREGEPLCMTGVQIHILPHGATFDLNTRTASPPES